MLGLRYEYYPLMTRADRGLERWDIDTNKVIIGAAAATQKCGHHGEQDIVCAQARVCVPPGLRRMVIRSGYGITYDPLPFSRPLRGPYPATIDQRFNGDNPFMPFRPIEQGIPEFSRT